MIGAQVGHAATWPSAAQLARAVERVVARVAVVIVMAARRLANATAATGAKLTSAGLPSKVAGRLIRVAEAVTRGWKEGMASA